MDGMYRRIHFPILFLCLGSVVAINFHIELFYLACSIISAYGVLFITFFYSCDAIWKKRIIPSVETVLQTFYIIGIVEVVYVLFQLVGVLNSFNSYFFVTGSFSSPVVLAMCLSLCIPIGIHFCLKSKSTIRVGWLFTVLSMLLVLLFVDSRTGLLAVLISVLIICIGTKRIEINCLNKNRNVILALFLVIALGVIMYFHKPDSVKGRFLIWKITTEMICDKPILGWGWNGFEANYMQCQANFFHNNPNSKCLMLADNINNPFNEFLLFTVKFGFVGLFILLYLIFRLIRSICLMQEEYKYTLLSLVVTILVWGMFSYPLRVTFVWIVISYLINMSCWRQSDFKIKKGKAICVLIGCVPVFILLTINTIYRVQWGIIQDASIYGKTKEMIPAYSQLMNNLKNDGDFLYNYGAELNYIGCYKESNDVLFKCMSISNDYNLQMLIADNFKNLGEIGKAGKMYDNAAKMIPSRFLPLYCKMHMYIDNGNNIQAFKTAFEIVNKQKKCESRTVNDMVDEARQFMWDIKKDQERKKNDHGY